MMEVGAWRAHNDAYLGAALRWLRLRLAALIADGDADPSLEARLARELRDAEASDPPPAIVLLGQAFALTLFERQTLLLCVATGLDTRIGALCARAQDDGAKTYPTFALALALFDEPAWEALSASRPLRYWRLVDLSPRDAVPLTLLPLQADERIVHFAKGLNTLDARLLPLLTPVPRPELPLVSSQQEVADAVARAHAGGGHGFVQISGVNRAAKTSVAAAAAWRIGVGLHALSVEALALPPAEADAFVRLWHRESRLLPLALYVDLHDAAPTPIQLGALRRLAVQDAETVAGPLLVSVREPSRELSAESRVFEIETPTGDEQRAIWASFLDPSTCNGPERLSTFFDFDAAEIARIATVAAQDTAPESLCARLWRDSVAFGRPRLNGLAQRIEPRATWEDIVLPSDTLHQLQHIAEQVRHRHQVYDAWGWRARMGRGLGVTALFAGESGTGKTMAAEVLAHDLALDLYRIDLSSIVSKYIGETEKNLREVFDAAEHGGALLLFDEADALFGKRSEVKDSHDRYANIEVNYLLQRLEAYDGVAVLATNLRSALDQSFVRRLRFIVPFAFPGQVERRAIWERVFPRDTPVAALDYERLARLTLNGAAIHSIALNAAFIAAARRTAVDMTLLREAARMELRKRERPTNEAEAL